MKNKWLGIGLRFAAFVPTIMGIVENVKGAKGPEKKAAVLEAIQAGVGITEFALEKDLLNDAAVLSAASTYIDAIAALQNAVAAAKASRALVNPKAPGTEA